LIAAHAARKRGMNGDQRQRNAALAFRPIREGQKTMRGFAVTFERYLPHDDEEDVCEADESGFEAEDCSFREAVNYAGGRYSYYEPDYWPTDGRDIRWLTNYGSNEGTHDSIERGIHENRSIHIPSHVTPSSRRRIARVLGVQVRS
jgi:hypothetical protein